jgi:hypothetical protein
MLCTLFTVSKGGPFLIEHWTALRGLTTTPWTYLRIRKSWEAWYVKSDAIWQRRNMLDLIQPYSLSTPDGVILLARHDSRYSTEREQWDGVGVSQPLVRTQQTRFLSFARSLHFASLTPFFVQPIVPLHLLTRSTGRWRCILAGETIMIQSIMAWQYQVR